MSDLRIERAKNGYELSFNDPKIEAANTKSEGAYKSAHVSYVFTDRGEMVTWLTDNLDMILPEPQDDEFTAAFNANAEEK